MTKTFLESNEMLDIATNRGIDMNISVFLWELFSEDVGSLQKCGVKCETQ